MLMEETEKREYFRLEVRLPIEFRKITYEEYVNLENSIKYSSTQSVDISNEMQFLKEAVSKYEKEKGQLHAYMQMINKKLDIILDLLNKTKDEELYISKYIDVNISGSGIRFTSEVELHTNEYVELKIVLPRHPYPKITTLCQVVRSQTSEAGDRVDWEVALKFLTINEDDRDLLISYIFEKERELLRNRKEQAG